MAISLRILAACAIIGLLHVAAAVFVPIIVAVFAFFALDPIVGRMGRHMPRLLASVLAVAIVLGSIGISAVGIWPQVEAVVAKIPEGAERLRRTMRELRARSGEPSTLWRVQEAAKAIDQAAAESTAAPVTRRGTVRVEVTEPWRASDWLWHGGMGAVGFAGQAVTVLFLTIFLLNESDSFKRKIVSRMETIGSERISVAILNDIAQQIERFMWVQALTSALVAVVTTLGLWWLDVEQPVVWGVFAGLMNIVPYLGPLVVTVVLSTVALLQFGATIPTLKVTGMALAITTLEGNLLTPHLLSRAAAVNHVAIFLSIAFWSWLWGVVGMLLAVPLLMAMKVVCDHVTGLEFFAELLGE